MAARSFCSTSQTQRILSHSTASTRCCYASALPSSNSCFSSSSSSSIHQRSALSSSISASSIGRCWGHSCLIMMASSPRHCMATRASDGRRQRAGAHGAATSLVGARRSNAPQQPASARSAALSATSQDQQPSPSQSPTSTAAASAVPLPPPASAAPAAAAAPMYSPLHVNIEEFCRKLAPTEDEKKVKSIVIER